MSTEPPKRTESAELTLVCPRESLPPVSTVPGPTIDQLADVERARRDAQDLTETLVACPACADCRCCFGAHMVSAERCAEWQRQRRIVATEDDADELPIIDGPEAA